MLFKSCPVKIKAAGEPDGLNEGEFEAIVSVFGNVDSYGDVVVPGAFTDSLAEWAAKGDPIPVYYSHRMDDPDFNIGEVLEAKEITEGLWVKGLIDVEDPLPGSKAPQVHRLMKGRRLTQFSFAYDIVEAGWVTVDEDEFFELRKLKIHEIGPTPIGANDETELLGIKAAGRAARHLARRVKAGRMLSAKNETALRESLSQLEDASAGIKDVLAAIGDEPNDDEKAKDNGPVNDEEPSGAKSEEPSRPSPADLSALLSIELADAS